MDLTLDAGKIEFIFDKGLFNDGNFLYMEFYPSKDGIDFFKDCSDLGQLRKALSKKYSGSKQFWKLFFPILILNKFKKLGPDFLGIPKSDPCNQAFAELVKKANINVGQKRLICAPLAPGLGGGYSKIEFELSWPKNVTPGYFI